MSIVNHDTGEIVETIGAAEARRLTTEAQNEFRSGAAHTARGWELVEEAVLGGGHVDLGYRSPGDYLHAEFDGILSGFNIADRRLAVRTMTDWGLSTRAIAKPLGVSQKTVDRDTRAAGESCDSPAQTPAPSPLGEEGDGAGQTPQDGASRGSNAPQTPAEESTETAPRPAVTGRDGKTYTRPEPKPRPRRALPDQFFDAAYDLTKVIEKLVRLADDDRFPQNAEKVAAKHRDDLIRARDALDGVLARMP